MGLLLLFIDGLGLGARDNNPLFEADVEVLAIDANSPGSFDYKGGSLKAIDATLGVPGLPQSATGQTALFTGFNCSKIIGRHKSGWPDSKLRKLLRRDSIFLRLKRAGRKAVFANAFTPAYFLNPHTRMGASTLHALYADIKPRWIWQIPLGQALFQDFTNRFLIRAGFDLPEHTPEIAGANLAGMIKDVDFVLFEYFLTDAVAHKRIDADAVEIIRQLDAMIRSLLDSIDLDRHTVVLCSDHGNLEDSRNRSHTDNPVPLIAWGPGKKDMLAPVSDLTGIKPAVCDWILN